MKNKKLIIILSIIGLLIIIAGYTLWANKRADHYSQVSRETKDVQEKILSLEKSIQFWPKTENVLALADIYISIGRNDLAGKIMLGRGDLEVLNKLGSLYLSEDKIEEAEKAFIKANNKDVNSESLKGLILVVLKKGDRGEAESYLNELKNLNAVSANCYASFVYLNDFQKAENTFIKAKKCNLYGIDEYFANHNKAQSPLYLRLEATNLYYSMGYLNLAEKDILSILRENNNYRDAHVLASKIYEKLGDQTKSDEHKKGAFEIDPF